MTDISRIGDIDWREEIVVPDDVRELAERVGGDALGWYHNCHAASLTIVKAEVFPGARVARGHAQGVGFGQHSWVVVGSPYDQHAEIIDPTLWSYDRRVPGVWSGTLADGVHSPHGAGHFMTGSRPTRGRGDIIGLTPRTPLSPDAWNWLRMLGPLDAKGWREVAHLPVEGWPAGEIIAAMDDTPGLGAFIPIDILGMVTDRNPSGLYLPGEERS